MSTIGLWILRVLGATLVNEKVAADLVETFFKLLRGVVDKTDTKLDDALLSQLEAATDKAALAKVLATWLSGRLGGV